MHGAFGAPGIVFAGRIGGDNNMGLLGVSKRLGTGSIECTRYRYHEEVVNYVLAYPSNSAISLRGGKVVSNPVARHRAQSIPPSGCSLFVDSRPLYQMGNGLADSTVNHVV
jgi:hypothetical protein